MSESTAKPIASPAPVAVVGEFLELVAADERVAHAVAPTGAGVLLVVREPTAV